VHEVKNPYETPPLTLQTENDGFILRELTVDDAQAYFESFAVSRKEIADSDGTAWTKNKTIDDVKDNIVHSRASMPDMLRMGMWKDDRFVGCIHLKTYSTEAEISYWLDSRQTGHGYATFAVRTLSTYAAEHFPSVFATVNERNNKSAAVLIRAGFRQSDGDSNYSEFTLEKTPEVQAAPEINQLTHPRGYFDAQVLFAKKWSDITKEDFATILLHKTALYRRIQNKKAPEETPVVWKNLLAGLDLSTDHIALTNTLYEAYSDQPHSRYDQPHEPHAFGYDYLPGNKVKIHFKNPVRGESPFSVPNLPKREIEFKQMLENIAHDHPEAGLLTSASWIRSTKSYQSLFPPNRASEVSLMAPDMDFEGDSVWGQFIDKYGQTNTRIYDTFIDNLAEVKTIRELIEAFPYKLMRAEDPIALYYAFYGVIINNDTN
jgi:RimJ/RimL family protein N-acetyltransferase